MIKAILFDMDGVLLDSEEFICKAAIAMFKEKGLIVRPEDFLPFVGKGEDLYLGGVAELYNFELIIKDAKQRTYDIYMQIVEDAITGVEAAKNAGAMCLGLTTSFSIKELHLAD